MPQFTDSVLFLFVRALDPTVMGSVLQFTYFTQVIKGNGFRLRAECSGWPGMYGFPQMVNSKQNLLITCQLNNDKSMRPLLRSNGAHVSRCTCTALWPEWSFTASSR